MKFLKLIWLKSRLRAEERLVEAAMRQNSEVQASAAAFQMLAAERAQKSASRAMALRCKIICMGGEL